MEVVVENDFVGLKFSLVATIFFFAIKRYFKAEGKFVINLYPAVYYFCSIAISLILKTLQLFMPLQSFTKIFLVTPVFL